MTKVKNTEAYPYKQNPVPNDFVTGSDSEDDGKTVNYKFQNILDLLNSMNGIEVVSYRFALSPIGELDENGAGYFLSENNETDPSLITKLIVSKEIKTGIDLSDLFTFMSNHENDFTLKVRNVSDPNNFIYFSISNITEQINQFTFFVSIEGGDNFVGDLVDSNVYNFEFDFKSSETVVDATPTVKGILKLAGDLGGTADLPTVPGLSTKQNTLTDSIFGTFINALTLKTTPVDADFGVIMDSADSNKSKKVSWANIKATLKTYFDTLYATVSQLATKQDTLVSATNIRTIEGQSLLGSGNIDLTKSDVGLSNVDNTSDSGKPISTATQTALNLKENAANKQNSLLTDGTGVKFPTVDAINASILQTEITLTDATTTVWDYSLGSYANWTIAGNRTLSITNLPSGKVSSGMLRMTQNGTGGFVPILAGTSIDVSFRVAANDKNLLGFYYDGTTLFWSSSYTGSPQMTITTAVSITTATTDAYGNSQKGKNVVIANGASAINITVNGGADFVTSYVKNGSGAITFVQGSGRTLVQVDGTAILSGAVGSTATVSSVGTTDYLRISNA